MQRVYALPIAQNDTKTFNPVFVTVSVQGCLTEADAALINNPSFDTPQTTGWLGRMWERFEAAPDDDPTHWKAKLRKTVAPKTDTQHLLLHTTATDHVVVEIAHPTTLGPSAIQRLIHEITDKPEAIAVFAGLLPLSVAGAAVIPIFGKFVLASNLYHLFDSTKAVKGIGDDGAVVVIHVVCSCWCFLSSTGKEVNTFFGGYWRIHTHTPQTPMVALYISLYTGTASLDCCRTCPFCV